MYKCLCRNRTKMGHFGRRWWKGKEYVLATVLKGKRIDRIYRYKEIYYKKFAHVIMETDKSQDLQLASWGPKKSWSYKFQQRHRTSQCFSSSVKGGNNWCPISKAVKQEDFPLTHRRVSLLYYSGLPLIWWGQPTLGSAICFTQFTNLNVNLIQKHTHRHTQNNVWPNVWATPWPTQADTKLTITGCLVKLPRELGDIHYLESWGNQSSV